jgi:hypothetical protein
VKTLQNARVSIGTALAMLLMWQTKEGFMKLSIAVLAFVLLAANVFAQSPPYDPATEATVSGTVRYVLSATSADGTVGVHLVVNTSSGPARIHLGPAMFIGMNNFSFLTDDPVEITGATVTRAGETAIWARTITKNGKTLTLRDEDGTPRWPRATAEDPDGCGVEHAPIRY